MRGDFVKIGYGTAKIYRENTSENDRKTSLKQQKDTTDQTDETPPALQYPFYLFYFYLHILICSLGSPGALALPPAVVVPQKIRDIDIFHIYIGTIGCTRLRRHRRLPRLLLASRAHGSAALYRRDLPLIPSRHRTQRGLSLNRPRTALAVPLVHVHGRRRGRGRSLCLGLLPVVSEA